MKYEGFYDLHQMRMYLTDSVIRRKNEPFYIDKVERVWKNDTLSPVIKLRGTLLRDNKKISVNLKSNSINLDPVPLGFFQSDYKLYIATRVPYRMWKIGLHSRNLRIEYLKDIIPPEYAPHHQANNSNLIQCICNEYSSYRDTYLTVMKSHRKFPIPFHRNFALGKKAGHVLIYSSIFKQAIGYVSDLNIIKLDIQFNFLYEQLKELCPCQIVKS